MTFPFPAFSPSVVTDASYATGSHSVSSSNLTNYSGQFDSKGIGTASGRTALVLGIMGSDGTSTISTVKVNTAGGGTEQVAATYITRRQAPSGSGLNEIWIIANSSLPNPSATTLDIDIVFASGQVRAALDIIPLYDSATSATDTGGASSDSASSLNDGIDCPAGGVIVGFAHNGAGTSPTFTWTNIDELSGYDEAVETISFTGAAKAFAAAQTGLTVTAAATSSGPMTLTLASFARAA